ncbi:hypothetical protein JCM6882_004839 [Rhodosporidiobolus microsporus]
MSSTGANSPHGSPPPSPSSLDKLPVELLKRIVELVHEQDKAFGSTSVQRADWHARTDDEDEDVDEELGEDVAKGRWAFAYGRGVQALSRVNKRLRDLALPYLFETTTLDKLAEPFFRYDILNTPLCKLIKRVEMGRPQEQEVFDVAWALPLLPNLTRFALESHSDGFPISWNGATGRFIDLHAAEMGRTAFRKVVPAVTALRLSWQGIRGLRATLSAMGSSLKSLEIEEDSSLLTAPATDLVAVLRQFDLEALSIETPPPTGLDDSWRALTPYPSLSSLSISVGSLGHDLLSFIEQLAPNLTRLTLTRISNSSSFANLEPSAALTKLAHLRLEGHYSFTRLTRFFSSTPLRTLTLRYNSQTDRSLQKILPSFDLFPSSLRVLRCEIFSRSRPRDEEQIRTTLAERGISFEVAWTPSKDILTPDSRGASLSSATTLEQEQRRAIKEDCKWASRQADWLLARGDKAGMQELAEAVRRVREKRILEQQ